MTVIDLVQKHEGCDAEPYDDSRGFLTVGIGHNLVAHPLPDETYPLTTQRIQEIFAADMQDVVTGLAQKIPWLQQLDEVRQAGLIDMSFEMGVDGVLEFSNTLASIRAGNWQDAHDRMLQSRWDKQVPGRAEEDASMMLSGLWPDDPNFPEVTAH